MLEDSQKINAIAWEAKKRNLSYGIFSAILTEENKQKIYKEYEKYLLAKKKAEKEYSFLSLYLEFYLFYYVGMEMIIFDYKNKNEVATSPFCSACRRIFFD